MRLHLVAAVAAVCAVTVAHAQLSFGPGGVSTSPINLVKVYGYFKSAWDSYIGAPVKPETTKETVKVSKAESRSGLAGDYNSDLEDLKSRIQAASDAAAGTKKVPEQINRKRGQKISSLRADNQEDEESPLLRALLLPKKKIVVGKWPWVYGVLNGVLLGAALVLAKPYFFEGETVVTQYEDEKEYEGYGHYPHHYSGYGPPSHHGGYGHHQSFEHAYAAPPQPHYGNYHSPQPAYSPRVPAKAAPVVSYQHDSDEHNKNNKREIPKTSTKPRFRPQSPPRVVHGPPFELTRPNPGVPNRQVGIPRIPTQGSQNIVKSQSSKDEDTDPPLNELHYYNPTIFVSPEASSYGCLEKMVCINPSRTARSLAESSAGKIMARAIASGGAVDADRNWAQMMERLDVASEQGNSNKESCVQYYCPPPVPNLEESGLSYVPPPTTVNQLQPVFSSKVGSDKVGRASSSAVKAPSKRDAESPIQPLSSPPKLKKIKYPRVVQARNGFDYSDDDYLKSSSSAVARSAVLLNSNASPEPEPEPETAAEPQPESEPEPSLV